MTNFRIFIEKQAKYNIEAQQLLRDLRQNLQLSQLNNLRVINLYDVFNITQAELERAKFVVFAEAPVDQLYLDLVIPHINYFAVEPLPGQYDQRADSTLQALNLLEIDNPQLSVSSGKLIVIDDSLSGAELAKIKNYYLNPLEMREKDLTVLQPEIPQANYQQVPSHVGFTRLSSQQLADFRQQHGLAMTAADLVSIQDYFSQTEQRDPTETEIKVLDTYWSDHCRHTTFETQLTDIQFAAGHYQGLFQQVFKDYLASRAETYTATVAAKRPISLMDLATICGKQFRAQGRLSNVEFSDEINACSLIVEIEVSGKPETWSLQFKNETHNHPTEIEPYGGASTCVGGAIRDPLSGRAYVYQAMRVSGAANPLEAIEDTLAGKLPQKVISTRAANGFSSYGNQIGLATTHVSEIYHPGYKAKRMEVGMVVAAAPFSNIRREQPVLGDVIILVGGRTGRDGCGGATGSSKEQDSNSAALCGAEVQKGNPIVERKIQRLFRNPQATRLIKKCNDFGAGGVSVAIGELADGVTINLDQLPTKYLGLSGSELAISESQERMAVVVKAAAAQQFCELAAAENLEAVCVATVSAEAGADDARMTMYYRGQAIVDISRQFLNTNGAKSYATIQVSQPGSADYFSCTKPEEPTDFSAKLKLHLARLNICSQQGLVERFDATIGSTTVLMPYGGKYQLTPTQVSVQKLPLLSGTTDNASIASYGFDPELSSWSPFHGAVYAVVASVAKIVAAGADFSQIKFSFQEYFERLGTDPQKWGKPFAALLGAYHAQQGFGLAAIGGKDSMSGSFNDLHVPPTLISFAVAPTLASKIISPEFKNADEYIYVFIPRYNSHKMLDFAELTATYQQIKLLIAEASINAAWAIGYGGIAEAVCKMAFGNFIGADLNALELHGYDLFSAYYGGLVFSCPQPLAADLPFKLIGRTCAQPQISAYKQEVSLSSLLESWQQVFAGLFPLQAVADLLETGPDSALELATTAVVLAKPGKYKIASPRVIIPVFPGTNCEYDSLRAFSQAGADCQSLIFNNLSASHIQQSISNLVAAIKAAQILMLPGGFSAGDEPDGSAKFIATILRNPQISDAVHELLARDGLILGICNGFQALIKSGLLPYGQISALTSQSATLTYNRIGRHISRLVPTKVVSNRSPWLASFRPGTLKQVAMSHGEGRLIISPALAAELAQNGQIACQYVDLDGRATLDDRYNPNGSDYAIEALCSASGQILGKMGHSERYGNNLYKNICGDKTQDIFTNGVNYFN